MLYTYLKKSLTQLFENDTVLTFGSGFNKSKYLLTDLVLNFHVIILVVLWGVLLVILTGVLWGFLCSVLWGVFWGFLWGVLWGVLWVILLVDPD